MPQHPSPFSGRVDRAKRDPGGEELLASACINRIRRPHPTSLGYRLRSATLPENGEGCCGAIVRECRIQIHISNSQRAKKAKAPPPLLFKARGAPSWFSLRWLR